MTAKPDLKNITLCCIDTAQPTAALRALNRSRAQCTFGATLLLTDADITAPGIEVGHIEPIVSSAGYSAFVLKRLVAHILTPFVLIVQWDGYVLDGSRWEAGFCDFDYIGAPWPWHAEGRQVGNGGFSLRSRRLLEMLAGEEFPAGHPEDLMICHGWRPKLEARGLRFADVDTATRFAVERDRELDQNRAAFGFHGMFNFWRAVPEAELEDLLNSLSPGVLRSIEASQLMLNLISLQRWSEARLVMKHYEARRGKKVTLDAISSIVGHDKGRAETLRNAIMNSGGRCRTR